MCTWNRYVEASNEDGEHASVILITSTSFYVQLDDTTNDDDDDDIEVFFNTSCDELAISFIELLCKIQMMIKPYYLKEQFFDSQSIKKL